MPDLINGCRWSHGPEAGNPCGMNHHLPSSPELADLDRVVLGPAMPGTTRHWLLFDAQPAGILDMESGAFWPLRRDPDGRLHLATDPSRSSW